MDTPEDVRRLLRSEGRAGFVVSTGSMQPVIAPGTKIEVVPLREAVRRFDILVFSRGPALICHYLWHINRIPAENGREVFVTRSGRKPIRSSQQRTKLRRISFSCPENLL